MDLDAMWMKGTSIRINLIRLLLTFGRMPDKVIYTQHNESSTPYLFRWHIIPRNPLFNIYLHWFLQSDDDRALHDHPWWNMSWILEGSYLEITPAEGYYDRERDIADVTKVQSVVKFAGWFNRTSRQATTSHRIVLIQDRPAWTLFFTGRKKRLWGFECPKGWVPWNKFTDPNDSGKTGPGCGE